MSDDSPKRWDLKQVGTGGVSALAIMALFQSQGIDLMSKSQHHQTEVVIEKTVANAKRIDALEQNVRILTDKLDREFDSLRAQMRDDLNKISDIVRLGSQDRFTKTEHNSYASAIEMRLQSVEKELREKKSK